MGVLPGESWIVYQTDVGSGNAIWLMRPDATDAHPLVPEVTGEQKHPDWSPDGQRVVFIVSDDIWTAGADGTGAALLWDCGACDYPAWSPDGTRIAFTEYTSGSLPGPASSSIKVLDLATNEVTTVVEEQRPLLVDVARWSPDGTQLVMGVDQMDDAASETGAAVAVAPATGGPLGYLTDFESFAYYPDWSWVTDTIVFSTEALGYQATPGPGDDTWNLHTVQPDGTGLRQLTDVASGTRIWQPSWTPDGQAVIADLEANRVGVLVDASTGAVTVFASLADPVTHPRLRPIPSDATSDS
jgi:Tol biopolymer transport system component